MKYGVMDRATRMIANYAARLNTGQCGAARNVGLKGPAERFAAAMERVKHTRARTKALLEDLDVPSVFRSYYCTFALRLGKIVHNAWGEHACREEARILVTTWQARGLDRDIMVRIARGVFELEMTEEKLE
jgi:hypothetical protein